MSRVVKVPVARQHAAFPYHAGMQSRSGIRRLNVKRRRSDALVDGPIYSAAEDVFAVVIHAEHKAAVNHDTEGVEPVGDGFVTSAEILPLVASLQVLLCQGFKSDKDAAQSSPRCALNQVAAQNGIHGRGALKEAPHAFHALE